MSQHTTIRTDESYAIFLDEQDPLSNFRDRFFIPLDPHGRPSIYLCGNSLGPQSHQAAEEINQVVDQWRRLAVRGHFTGKHPWTSYINDIIPLMAVVLGALPAEVVPMGSLTENIHLLLAAFFQPDGERNKILAIGGGFPSDRYAINSMLKLRGMDPDTHVISVSPTQDEYLIPPETFEKVIQQHGSEIALVFLPAVQFASGQAFNLSLITSLAHNHGALVGFDLAHAAGNIPLNLHDWDVDFAAWCGYKYLSSGPGNGGGIYIHERFVANPNFDHLAGWWGNDLRTRFEMRENFEPLLTAERFQLSNPAIISLAPFKASLQMYIEAGLETIWEKSRKLSKYLEFLLDQKQAETFQIITPRDPIQRGNQISLAIHGDAVEVADALIDHRVIIDERPPNIIRVAPHPLYNTFHEVWQFVEIFSTIMKSTAKHKA